MSIERKVVSRPKKRDKDELIEKHKKIGDLLQLKKVPVHTLAWKESRLELDTADCYPIIDVLERLSELAANPSPVFESVTIKKKPKKAK